MYKNNYHIYRITLSIFTAILILSFYSCTHVNHSRDVDNRNFFVSEDFDYQFAATSVTRLDLSGINGNITITGRADVDSVYITGVRRVESESEEDAAEQLSYLTVRTSTNEDVISIRTDQPDNSNGRNYIVNYIITLPYEMPVSVSNINGQVTVEDMESDLYIIQTNGSITVCGYSGSLESYLINGNINVSMELEENGTCHLNTVNGNVSLAIPQSTSAQVNARITNGSISVSGIQLDSVTQTPTTLHGTLNQGDGSISLGTVNGIILISRLYGK